MKRNPIRNKTPALFPVVFKSRIINQNQTLERRKK